MNTIEIISLYYLLYGIIIFLFFLYIDKDVKKVKDLIIYTILSLIPIFGQIAFICVAIEATIKSTKINNFLNKKIK